MSTPTTPSKKLSTTITAMFENLKFGDEAKLSVPIDAKGYDAIMKNVEIGSRLVLRKGARPAKNGSATYFLDVLPRLEPAVFTVRTTTTTDDI